MPKILWKKGHPNYNLSHTEETKRKIKEHNAKYWLGTTGAMYGHRQTEEMKEKVRAKLKGRKLSPQRLLKNRQSHLGLKASIETRQKMSAVQLARYGLLAPTEKRLRWTIETKLWRESIFQRDNFTCVICKQRGKKIEADHIRPWALHPELRFDVNNGRTLCKSCHLRYGWRGSHTKKGQTDLLL